MSFITKSQYQQYKQDVAAFEKRQKQLDYFKHELSIALRAFSKIKFKVNRDARFVCFAGVYQDNLVIGLAKCSLYDVFDPVIGKLIAVRKSLHKSTKDVEKWVASSGYSIQSGTVNVNDIINKHNDDSYI